MDAKPSQRVTLWPVRGPSWCNVLVLTMCLLLPTGLDSGVARDLNQYWHEITPRVGNGSGERYARLLYPRVWRSSCQGQSVRLCVMGLGWSGRCYYTGALTDLCLVAALPGLAMGPSTYGKGGEQPRRRLHWAMVRCPPQVDISGMQGIQPCRLSRP